MTRLEYLRIQRDTLLEKIALNRAEVEKDTSMSERTYLANLYLGYKDDLLHVELELEALEYSL